MKRRMPTAAPFAARRPSLRRLLPVAALGAALALSACQTQSPIQTDVPYQAADGVPVDLGSVQVRDLVIVSGGKDKPGTLSASVSNTGGEAARIAFGLADVQGAEPVFAEIAAHTERRLTDSQQVQLPAVPVAAGSTVKLTVQAPSAPVTDVVVPVVAASNYYASLAPTQTPVSTTTTTTAP